MARKKKHELLMPLSPPPELGMNESWARMGHWLQIQPKLLWAYHNEVARESLNCSFDGQNNAVWFLESGHVTLNFESEQEHYKAPCWLFMRNKQGTQKLSPGSRLLSVRFTLKWPDETPLTVLDQTYVFEAGKFPRFEQASIKLAHFAQNIRPNKCLMIDEREGALLSVAGLSKRFWAWIEEYLHVLETFQIPLHARAGMDPRVAMALDQIQSLSLLHALHEKDLAASCGLSVAQLNRLFHQQVGLSPAQVRNKHRLSTACTALLYSKEAIKSLAYRLGFNSTQHFTFWFRKRMGQSPREFRLNR